ncbi:diguanylate cyclase [Aliidiomarina taiwanensis]|uniref:diguanylate cyclase n=1 Tax=Aliidiomarina taiwanensis TaxID=946228 RepID=A0A432X1K0_9GAMM|nr:sensor domain-containing diguanylate cyclase [Aliidiomarina taiwanensis]RUO40451.1 diguanylate cyclase [Aliidiomarina taiwanensis]
MQHHWYKKIKLRSLILSLGVLSILLTLASSYLAAYKVQRQLLIENTLESNRVYSAKLANVAATFVKTSLGHLGYSASMLTNNMDNRQRLTAEVERLHKQSGQFNSVVVVDKEGRIIASSPAVFAENNLTVSTPSASQSLNAKRPLVTDPFLSPAGNYLVSLSQPIFSEAGDYLGYISGSIYLEKQNILNFLLGSHDYKDGSYLYVVDRNRTIIYHPEASRVGELVSINDAVNTVTQGTHGATPIVNSKGIDMLAGFAPVELAGWGIVAQRPLTATLAPLNSHMKQVILQNSPLILLILLGVWLASTLISRPLWHLAKSTSPQDPTPRQHINVIRAWYFEAAQLKSAIIKSTELLNQRIQELYNDSQTDPMTGLLNRRGMQHVLEQYELNETPFAVMMCDLDHFKVINDTYGHDIGDQVIITFAALLKQLDVAGITLCRSGGEEFIVLIPHSTKAEACTHAQSLHAHLAQTSLPLNAPVTVSIGVAEWTGPTDTVHSVLKVADQALYKAKEQGRNTTVSA